MKILIVDKSSLVKKIIEKSLESLEVECLYASDGKTAWEYLRKYPDIKLVTLSMVLQDTSGIDFLKRCRSLPNITNLDFILITSIDDEQTQSRAFEYGAANFLSKPFEPDELLNICKRLICKDNMYSGSCILIADDSKVTRELLKKALQFLGPKIIEACDGKDAMEILENNPKIDLIITDRYMPQMNGEELTEKLRKMETFKSTPIIMLSATEKHSGNVMKLFKCGITDYICKPFINEELIARVKVHLSLQINNREMQENLNEMENLNRIKDEVLALCSHDIRSPLNAILGNAELLLEDNWEKTKNFAEDIKESAETVLDLVTNLLDTSKKQVNRKLTLEPVRLDELITKVSRQLKSVITNKKIDLKNALEEVWINGEERSLKRIFANLISNALKFTNPGGEIAISCRTEKDNVVIEVQDSGIGIPAEMLPVLFEKYTKASRPGTGGEKSTGLGMSIVKELVHSLNGRVSVKSEVGKGTAFTLTFPLTAKNTNLSSSANEIKTNPEVLKKSKVLIADDNKANLRLLEKMLHKQGICNIVKAEDGCQLLDLYMKNQNFDLIITDIEMPNKNGTEASIDIRAAKSAVKPYIVALSGHVDAEFPSGLFDETLTKPVVSAKLKSALNSFINQDKN